MGEFEADLINKKIKHSKYSEYENGIKAMIKLAKSEEGIPIVSSNLDNGAYLLNCNNVTLDLKTGNSREHRREDFITKLVQVNYNAQKDCPLWKQFLLDITGNNQELIDYLQTIVGYSLTGDTKEQCLFILYGTGANGKSTFIETIRKLLSDYTCTIDFESLIVKKGSSIPNDIAKLKGKRLILAGECEEEETFSEKIIKILTGQDTITARYLYGEFFDFKPTGKIFLATNYKPAISGIDFAIWRRIKLIPFNVTFPEDKQDRNLITKLEGELEGILAWAVEGCLKWQKDGIVDPQIIKDSIAEYKTETDIVGKFINDCCIVDPQKPSFKTTLYEGYRDYCNRNGYSFLNRRVFSNRLEAKGYVEVRTSKCRSYGNLRFLGYQ